MGPLRVELYSPATGSLDWLPLIPKKRWFLGSILSWPAVIERSSMGVYLVDNAVELAWSPVKKM